VSVIKAAVLTVKNLHKQYSRGRPKCLGLKRDKSNTIKVAVVDSSFAVDAGEIFGLLGPNGAGKSTTLNAIIAETRPTSGKVGISFVDTAFMITVTKALYTVNHKKRDILFLTITLANLNRFL